jgi:CMP-N-acetylneuraminic acid synthetase
MALASNHITAMIPARLGSERLAKKNLALLAGEPLIGHSIRLARASGVFDRIVVNSESSIFEGIAHQYNAEFYKRPERLATSNTKSDDVVYDFATHHATDVIVWVNPIAPLQPCDEVRDVVTHFVNGGLDSLITVREERAHCNFRGAPLNYNPSEEFAKTHELDPVERFVYSLMMWRRDRFIAEYTAQGHALLFGRMGFYPVSHLSSLVVKKEEDLWLCEYILAGLAVKHERALTYFPSTDLP